MQITNPPHYTTNCMLSREKLLLQQSVHRPHFDLQVPQLRPQGNLLCSGQPATLVLTDVKTGNIPLNPIHTGFYGVVSGGRGAFSLHPVTPFSSKLDDSNFV